MSKPKTKPRTREEIIADLKRKKEVGRKREIIVGKFYPALVEATISVDEAKALIQAMGSLIMEEVLKTMKDRPFSEIIDPLHKALCSDGERAPQITALLNTLKDENFYVAREIIEGMKGVIEKMILTEMMGRKLDTMTPEWDKYLN